MAELVGMHMSDPGPFGDTVDDSCHVVALEGMTVGTDQQSAAVGRRTHRAVVGDQVDQVGMERHVAVVVEFPDGYP
jgi:hypothetical protein